LPKSQLKPSSHTSATATIIPGTRKSWTRNLPDGGTTGGRPRAGAELAAGGTSGTIDALSPCAGLGGKIGTRSDTSPTRQRGSSVGQTAHSFSVAGTAPDGN